ncbi:BMA_0021/BMA_0022 family TOMM bacteriocin [Sorangium sp. So ce296]|uniref:BMA_0021/BMA_0022 family TOMM bacteriocin n=1 Tax=Sorangium sp. So ce296 TaxID=3133296 RepID=UPI003F5EDA11
MSDDNNVKSFQVPHLKEPQLGEPVPVEDPIQGIRGALEWQNAWMTAIALVWSDDTGELQDALIEDPETFFKKQCKYTLPAGIQLTVRLMPEKDDKGDKNEWNTEKRQWWMSKSEVVMYLPPAPADEKQRPVALSTYAATGRAYPFTFC